MKSCNRFEEAVETLGKLYTSRTGKTRLAIEHVGSEEGRLQFLRQGVHEEKIWQFVVQYLKVRTFKETGLLSVEAAPRIHSDDLADAVIKTGEMILAGSQEAEAIRRHIADLQDCSAYYDIKTSKRFPYGEQDLLQTILGMKQRIIWDTNSRLPAHLDQEHGNTAFIVGQTIDREENFANRRGIRNGYNNLFSFGVSELFLRKCLHIQRLQRQVVAAQRRPHIKIPHGILHCSPVSNWQEIQVILAITQWSKLWGKEYLLADILEHRQHCVRSYERCILIARNCAAMLLNEDAPELKHLVGNEWKKFLGNHPNALGDTMLIHNALFFDAKILTEDKGVKRMATYCGVKCLQF